MSFKIDKQTLNDLAIFGTGRSQSIYEIFNRTRTRGGGRLLEEMFQYPLSTLEEINSRGEIIGHYMKNGDEFPFPGSIFDAIEFYLDNTDSRSQLKREDNTLGRRVKDMMGTDTEYMWIHNGIVGCLEMLNTLEGFLETSPVSENKNMAGFAKELCVLLRNDRWQWFRQEKGKKKVSRERAVEYDRVFRFEERDKLRKLLYHIYQLDVYMTVAAISRERGFVRAKVLSPGKNVLKLKGLFHPFLEHPVGNDIEVDKDSNLLFLTGANMAGKSTFMKSFAISLFLAHVGFPVPAREMEFSVRGGMFTTINLPDNLNMGYSHFYAEVLRLKRVAQEVRQTPNLVIIFDELFRGTNVKDAYDATLAVSEAFSEIRNCAFMISTHIIEVGEVLKERCSNIKFIYLPTIMEGNKPVYTYRLASGITNDRHGMIIINNERIIEIIEGKGGNS